MKKLLLTVMLCITTLSALADIANGTCGENLTWVLSDEGTLTISGSGQMADYDNETIYAPWNKYKSKITKVIIEDGVTSIGSYAFKGYSSMTSVEFSNSITSIGEVAFYNCKGLTSIELPNLLKSIGGSAFMYCSLTTIEIPNSVTTIGSTAFQACSSLKSAKIGNSVTSIAYAMFWECSSLEYVKIGSSVTSIERDAFYRCMNLEKVLCTSKEPSSVDETAFINSSISSKGVLYVPEGSEETYKNADGWKDFTSISSNKCSVPTITFSNGKVSFSCNTQDAQYTYTIKTTDEYSIEKTTSDSEVDYTTPKIVVTAYATTEYLEPSDTVTETFTLSSGINDDVNGDGDVDSQDVLHIYEYMKSH